jgi:GR25 family glycosyltransferase involved in LPS biosynthesis
MILMKKIIFLFFLAIASLRADLEDHFKKLEHGPASEGQALRNIDFIYMINLDQRPEKWEKSREQLLPYGIAPHRFSAVNGWELDVETINDVGVVFAPEMEGGFMATSYHTLEQSHEIIANVGQTYFVHCMARGAIGCYLSHLSVLQDAYDRGYETIWVMEDDIAIIRDPRLLPDIIDALDQEVGKGQWDVLFTDKDMRRSDGAYIPCWGAMQRPDISFGQRNNDYTIRAPLGSFFYRIGCRFGTHSMIIRRSGMKKILQFCKAHKMYLPYDMDMIRIFGIKLYTVAEDVVGNLPKAASDNGAPYYLHKE